MIKRLVLLAALVASPAAAGQPIYKSMAECSGLFLALSDLVNTQERYDRMSRAQRQWADAARQEAGRDVDHIISQTANRWRSRGGAVAFTQEFKDWAAYCRSLSKDRGLGIYPKA